MGRIIEIPINPAFSIGERVEVSGVAEVPKQWEASSPGEVIGIAVEAGIDEETHHLQYHVRLDKGTHVYSLDTQLKRLRDAQDAKTIAISGIMLRAQGNEAIVELEIDGKWHKIVACDMRGSFSHIVEPRGIEEVIRTGRHTTS